MKKSVLIILAVVILAGCALQGCSASKDVEKINNACRDKETGRFVKCN